MLNRIGDRSFFADRQEFLPSPNARDYIAKQDVENGAEGERAQDSDRHIAPRILRFLGRCRDRVETDKGKKDDTGAAENAAPAMLKHAFMPWRARRNQERSVIGGVDEAPANGDKHNDDGDLDYYDH